MRTILHINFYFLLYPPYFLVYFYQQRNCEHLFSLDYHKVLQIPLCGPVMQLPLTRTVVGHNEFKVSHQDFTNVPLQLCQGQHRPAHQNEGVRVVGLVRASRSLFPCCSWCPIPLQCLLFSIPWHCTHRFITCTHYMFYNPEFDYSK